VFDGSRYQYGGVLKGLWVDISAEENFEMVVADPLSLAGFTTSTTILERSDLGWRTRSETTTNVWSEADGKGGYLYPTSPPSRPSSALKEKINPSQKRRYMAKSRAPGSDLRRGPGVLRRLNLSHGLALVGSFGLGVWGGRVLVHGNRVLLAPFFQDLRPASPYG
jgi:hypothetical protein